MAMEFQWDPNKAEKNIRRHQASSAEAATVFGNPLSMTFYDPDHSIDEDRYITVGLSRLGKLLVISHVDQGTRIRIISVQRATRREREFYEEHS